MCGIVGARHDWLASNGVVPNTAMTDAVAALAWRGPDGRRVERAGGWWLGCARLAITQPHSRQPVVRAGGRLAGVMNGAITNARELWARLLPGAERRPAPPNDAWLPLLLVERRDAVGLARLRGHHAFAVVDTTTNELVIGRDTFGEKPLVAVVERIGGARALVAFASTTAALAPLGASFELSPRRLSEWFRVGWHDERPQRASARRALIAVPSGGPWLVPVAAAQPLQPWSDAGSSPPGPRAPTDDVRAALCASVARCSDTSVPIALALSGGLDSSCLAVALGATGHRVPAYQVRAAGTAHAERNAAAAVAARTGLDLRRVDIDHEVLDALPFLTAAAGRPLGDPSILAVHALARTAAADGVRVLLSGEGADELFLGYRRYRALVRLPRARWLARITPKWSMRYAARWLRAVAAPDPVLALLAVTPPAFAQAVLAPELARRRCWRDDSLLRARHRDPDSLRRADLDGYLRCDLLPKIDVGTLAAGVEARCPFLEGDFAPLPHEDTRSCLGKQRLRTAFGPDLPTEVLRLPKTGFALPLDRWFRESLPGLDLLAEPRSRQRPHLRPGGLARAIDRHRRRHSDLGHGIWLLLAFEVWLRTQEGRFFATDRAMGAPDP